MSTTRKYELRLSSTPIFAAALEKCKENVVFLLKIPKIKKRHLFGLKCHIFCFVGGCPYFLKRPWIQYIVNNKEATTL